MKPQKIQWYPSAVLCLLLPALVSCYNVKKVVYFSNLSDTASGKFYIQDSVQSFQALIEPGDLLDVNVTSLSAAASAPFNSGNALASGGDASGVQGRADLPPRETSGYLVGRDGNIDFPLLGKVRAAGESTAVLGDTLESLLQVYLTQASVNVRFLNYKITVLGEVNRPATYTITGEKVSIIDALGMAGDLTIYGKRENILVVREVGGRREFARMNLASSNIFQSPYYFLKQNDIVYVEPSRPKISASDERAVRDISIGTGLLAIVLSLVYLLK